MTHWWRGTECLFKNFGNASFQNSGGGWTLGWGSREQRRFPEFPQPSHHHIHQQQPNWTTLVGSVANNILLPIGTEYFVHWEPFERQVLLSLPGWCSAGVRILISVSFMDYQILAEMNRRYWGMSTRMPDSSYDTSLVLLCKSIGGKLGYVWHLVLDWLQLVVDLTFVISAGIVNLGACLTGIN